MKTTTLLLIGAAATGLAITPALAQKAAAPAKAYIGPAAHVACAKLPGDKRDACIRNLPSQVFSPVKSPAIAKAAAATAGATAVAAAPAAAKAAVTKSVPVKLYTGPAAHIACGKLPGDKRDACIRKLPTQVFSTVKAPAATAPTAAKAAVATPVKGYVGPAAHIACAKLPGDKRDACIRNLPVVKGPGSATVSSASKK